MTPILVLAACTADPSGPGPTAGYDVPVDPDSPWPKFRRTSRQDARSPIPAVATDAAPWTFATGKGIFSSPVIGADGTVYVGSADRTFYAIGPDGLLRWSFETGEIVDSAALLDDSGRVFFGSGDGSAYALDAATGDALWTFEADDPATNGAFIRWFEGNVAMRPGGELVVPNDNFFVYSLDRDTGEPLWAYRMYDQTWSSPAVDAATDTLYVGNNNQLGAGNTFALDGPTGTALWTSTASQGSVAASPLLSDDGALVVGGFDGYLRTFDPASGAPGWTFAARDHLYASPALLSDGTVVQAGADGTVYALDPRTGEVVWAYDTPDPIRSSPAVGADDLVYVGGGDGRLYVLEADGRLRWSLRLVAGDRNDLNASPALGRDGVVVAGESGEVFFVPYDWCLVTEDARCATGGEDLPDDGVFLQFATRWGSTLDVPPAAVGPTDPLAFALAVRADGDTRLALLDTDLGVTVTPAADFTREISADRRFVVLVPPEGGWPGDGFEVRFSGTTLVDPERDGLRMDGGTPDAPLDATFSFAVEPGPDVAPLAAPGDQWALSRLAAPLPTLMPSYNQIGFDSLHYLVTLVEFDGRRGVAWVAGATPEGAPDPRTRALFPVEVAWDAGGLSLVAGGGMTLEAMGATLSFDAFRIGARLDETGSAPDGAVLAVSATCGDIPLYGVFLRDLGLCNPDTDALVVFGGAELHAADPAQAPALAADAVVLAREPERLVATVATGWGPEDHRVAILALDATTGAPVPLDYGADTVVTATVGGLEVSLPLDGAVLPEAVRLWLLVDGYPAATATP